MAEFNLLDSDIQIMYNVEIVRIELFIENIQSELYNESTELERN
jgi:hypothetical protein